MTQVAVINVNALHSGSVGGFAPEADRSKRGPLAGTVSTEVLKRKLFVFLNLYGEAARQCSNT